MIDETQQVLKDLGCHQDVSEGALKVTSPIDGSVIASLNVNSPQEVDSMIEAADTAFKAWRSVPAPARGELIRVFGELLRENKQTLARLVSIECGKILQEGLGEVQEMIDICDFAVGLSRQLYGLTIASERPGHKMTETWHPMGPVGVISAFNFPVAVWAWNTTLALVCGDSVVWKPSEKTPLTALACQSLMQRAIEQHGQAPKALCQLLIGGPEIGMRMVDDRRIRIISATGSCAMGAEVAPRVASRFGRAILELGGNNAVIVCPSADLKMALQAVVFGAVGTAGQRCTSTRRLFVHSEVFDEFVAATARAYASVAIGSPLVEANLMGPLIDASAFTAMQSSLALARDQGGQVTGGERVLIDEYPDAYYVRPALVQMPRDVTNVAAETFAPILYVFPFDNLEDAICANNDVPQGLSSAIFTNDLKEAELFISVLGSDCGIANVNIGTSGAEIGGAFGGEKETGGGRESGSDAWKGYMRRSTSTVNYSDDLPLAQGITFSL